MRYPSIDLYILKEKFEDKMKVRIYDELRIDFKNL